MIILLLVILLILAMGGMPIWPYSVTWGWAPSSLVLAALLIQILTLFLRPVP